MGVFDYEWENNKPVLKSQIHVELRNNGLFIQAVECVDGAWIQIQLSQCEKRTLLRTLFSEFLEGGLG